MTKQEALQKIEELKKFIEQEESGERWKPEYGEEFFFVDVDGDTNTKLWENSSSDQGCFEIGNVFSIIEKAEEHRIRLLSIANRGKMPEFGEEVCKWNFEDKSPQNYLFGSYIIPYWYIGAVHKTQEACEEWGKTYAKYFERE